MPNARERFLALIKRLQGLAPTAVETKAPSKLEQEKDRAIAQAMKHQDPNAAGRTKYQQKWDVTAGIIRHCDPHGLLGGGAPGDEFDRRREKSVAEYEIQAHCSFVVLWSKACPARGAGGGRSYVEL